MAREDAHLSQAELARLSGVKPGTIWDIEQGRNKNPSHAIASRIVRALKGRVSPDLPLSEDAVFGAPELPRHARHQQSVPDHEGSGKFSAVQPGRVQKGGDSLPDPAS